MWRVPCFIPAQHLFVTVCFESFYSGSQTLGSMPVTQFNAIQIEELSQEWRAPASAALRQEQVAILNARASEIADFVVITMPNCLMTCMYCAWFVEAANTSGDVKLFVMHPDLFVKQFGEEAFADFSQSILSLGRPCIRHLQRIFHCPTAKLP
jgi:hypothetical protein